MAGWLGGNMGNIPDMPPFASKRLWAWWPTSSTESGEPLWLKRYWRVETYELNGPDTGSKGQGWIAKVWRLTEDEYLLYVLSISPA